MINKQTVNKDQKSALKTAKIITADVEFQPMAEQESNATATAEPSKESVVPAKNELGDDDVRVERATTSSKSTIKKWFLILCILVMVGSIAELVLFVIQLTQQRDWLAGLWLVIFVGLLLLLTQLAWKEWRGLKRLKIQQASRNTTQQMFHSQAIGLAEKHCMQIAQRLPTEHQARVQAWRSQLEDHLTDNEVLCLFENQVLSPVDKLAIKTMTKNASAAGVMIAVSPFALLDMAIVLWRNIRMINQVSEVYGVKVGYWGRIKLIKNIFHTMVYAGAAEILSDAGNYALGAGITGKLSSRIAQGLGASVLTARIGLRAMSECRPMPCLSVSKPNLTVITKQLLEDLNRKIH
ncbi:TIGR01620 family protein [Paraglaciecola aquimarina]|uniref:TIGR01620 family protein n=1 Tax=Paraglaciecola aquimarina TaxID=1235557 RepID=A0ABU3T011_9ALTE|nr:TIGR01620 family protein [Paraglaciecola aquimarina]MDU0355603.1 TIGR01620 family protein [Paraglaciecola aquimarina]